MTDDEQLARLDQHWRIVQPEDDLEALARLVASGRVQRRRQRRGMPDLVRIAQPPEAMPWVGRGGA